MNRIMFTLPLLLLSLAARSAAQPAQRALVVLGEQQLGTAGEGGVGEGRDDGTTQGVEAACHVEPVPRHAETLPISFPRSLGHGRRAGVLVGTAEK